MMKQGYQLNGKYHIIDATPATGILYIANGFLSGHVRLRGKGSGQYPYNYLEMIDNVFGKEPNTIEVCSGAIEPHQAITVDIDSNCKPLFVGDGQILEGIHDNTFNRWRCDPPYNQAAAQKMWHCDVPNPLKLLKAGARVCKVGSMMFLLLGPVNYQWCPKNTKRIGMILITVVPNNEIRCLNIYQKLL